MQIQDEHPSTLSLTELLSDQQNKVKVVRILYQALTSMGFTESAQELQKESQIYPEQETQSKVRILLSSRRYKEVASLVEDIHISSQKRAEVQLLLKQLNVLQLIQQKDYETAIASVIEGWPEDEEKQLKFLSTIATDQAIDCQEFQKRQAIILQQCTSQSYQLKKNIDIMLRGYLCSSEINSKVFQEEQPYRRTIAESEKFSGLGKPSIVRFSPKEDLICLVTESRHRQIQASIWMLHGNKITMGLHWKQQNFGNVCSLSWDPLGEKISICSQGKLGIFDAVNFKPKIILDSKNILNSKLLCCRWNSKGLLYVGGLTNALAALDEHGNLTRTIRPFMKTREMIFSSNDELYCISATQGTVIRYNVKEQKIISSFESQHCFMDLYLNEKAQTLVVTNKQNIYLLNWLTLEPMTSLISPNNEKMFKIEAFFINNWLVIFNEKLTAVLQNHLVTRHHLWPDCDAVDVRGNLMVTAKSSLMVWQSQSELQPQKQTDNNIYCTNSDNFEEAEWYSQELEQELLENQEMHSISSHSSSSSDSQESASSPIDEQNQVQIEYIQNQDDSQEQSQEI